MPRALFNSGQSSPNNRVGRATDALRFHSTARRAPAQSCRLPASRCKRCPSNPLKPKAHALEPTMRAHRLTKSRRGPGATLALPGCGCSSRPRVAGQRDRRPPLCPGAASWRCPAGTIQAHESFMVLTADRMVYRVRAACATSASPAGALLALASSRGGTARATNGSTRLSECA
jgi:hypothetical protein